MLAVLTHGLAGTPAKAVCTPYSGFDQCQTGEKQKEPKAAKSNGEKAQSVKKIKKRDVVRKAPDKAKKPTKKIVKPAIAKDPDQAKSNDDTIQQETEAALVISDAKAFVQTSQDATLNALITKSIDRLEKAVRDRNGKHIKALTTALQAQLAQVQERVRQRAQMQAEADKKADEAKEESKSAELQQIIYTQKRVALVIGNSKYRNVSALRNPANDARDMARLLKQIGFAVTELHNLDRDSFDDALAAFAEESEDSDFSMLYYAGHGIEVDKRNYLIPIDAKLTTDRRLRREAIPLDDILDMLAHVKGIRLVFLDACRNNPFADGMRMVATRSVGRGFIGIEAPYGTVVSYSAKEGMVATDGAGRNSPFTAALLNNIAEPGLEIQFLLRRVRDSVRAATDGEQEPFISASLPGDYIYLVPPSP